MIESINLHNSVGTSLDVITLGAAITSLRVADRDGNFEDVVLGFGTAAVSHRKDWDTR